VAVASAVAHTDHRQDPAAWAHQLGISKAAVELHLASEVIDLHIDSFIWQRVFGYDLTKRHSGGLLGARCYSQVDFPRILEAGVSGATWVITTNPLRSPAGRAAAFSRNLHQLQRVFASVSDSIRLVRNATDYQQARTAGQHAAFIGVQGGNAFDREAAALHLTPNGLILRVTLVHLSSSSVGSTSAPLQLGRDRGLTDWG